MKIERTNNDECDAKQEKNTIQYEDLAANQWILINKLEADYQGKYVYGTECRFEDDRWFNGDGRSDDASLKWDSNLNLSRSLKLLLKVVFFEMILSRRILISTVISSKLATFRHIILPIIQTKFLLNGAEGELQLGLNGITNQDLQVAIDSRLVSAYSKENFIGTCYELNNFIEYANQAAERAPIYQINACMPWRIAGILPEKWVGRRAADLDHAFRKTVGFVPLASETVNPIIERSLSIIYDFDGHFKSMSQVLAYFDSQVTEAKYKIRNRKTAVTALEKYGSIFANILVPPETKGVDTAELIRLIIVWMRQLLYLARGACVNIILLTTGLRNSDIRGLQSGCCESSRRVDMLYYLDAFIKKTKNKVLLPVPEQTNRAVKLLQDIKFTKSPYLLDGLVFAPGTKNTGFSDPDSDSRVLGADGINRLLREFAEHFNIPFSTGIDDSESSAHCYRTTVAGWLGSASALSMLMVRRLFGHSNDVMPTVYLRNNPSFIKERESIKAQTASATSYNMANAAASGNIAGLKGEQLEAGYMLHSSQFQKDKSKSYSLTDIEMVTSFAKVLEQRLLSENIFGFPTPFGVLCGRNPSDTSQAPCARRSQRNNTSDVDQSLLDNLSAIDPANCIGGSCKEAMIGPWSESIKETLIWYAKLLRHQLGENFTEKHFQDQAISFIRQYSAPIKKVFHVEVLADGTVNDFATKNGLFK
jgi:integrase